MEEELEGEVMKEVEELATRLAEAIRKLERGDARMVAALAAVSMIVERSQLTLTEQAALVKLLDLIFSWGAKEVYERYQLPPGIV